jgi:5-methylcytosine-specific restriction protein B
LKAFKNIESAEEGMLIISDLIFSLVIQTDKVDLQELPFGWGFILKILHSYYPEKYFPANGQNYMSNILNLLGQENSTKSPLEKNLLLQTFFEKKKAQYGADIKNFEFMTWLDNEFDLKGEIALTEEKLVSKGESKLIQFHPAYTYEDFVRGIIVETNDAKQPEYRVVNKVMAEFAQKALDNKSSNYVLIIDEINRANLPSVLGELIYALEYRFDPDKPDETSVESMYSLREDDSESSEGKILKLPDNLLIIGTMNTADRSVGHIDYAIRRRFAFVDVLPTIDPVKNESAKEYFKLVSEVFVSNFENVMSSKATPKRSACLASDFGPEQVWIGHSYFITQLDGERGDAEIRTKMKYEVLPLIKEYVKDGILNSDPKKPDDHVQKVINELNQL